jgi:adhesin/invasin
MRYTRIFLAAAVLGAAACTDGTGGGDRVGPPANVAQPAGAAVTGTAGSTLAGLSVRVTDRNARPTPGVAVTWAVATGGGTITPSSTTDANGEARAAWTLGTGAGAQSATAAVAGLNPVTFTAAVAAGVPAAVTAAAPLQQSATAGATLAGAPAVKVTDAYGNPVAGTAVAFAVTGGGGSLTGAAQTTDASGLAAPGGWTIGTAAGANTVTATVAGVAPVAFTVAGTPGAPAQLQVVSGAAQLAVAGSALAQPIRVKVTDQYGNAVPGITVDFTVAQGAGSISPASLATAADGTAAVQLGAGASLGRGELLRVSATAGTVARQIDFYGRRAVLLFGRRSVATQRARAVELDWLAKTERYLTPATEDVSRAELSPDGSMLAYGRENASGEYELAVAVLATGEVRTVYAAAGREVDYVTWAPDNETVAFHTVGEEGIRVGRVNVRTGTVTADAFPGAEAMTPAYGPTGALAFSRRFVLASGGGQFDIVIAQPDGTLQRAVAEDGSELYPAFASAERLVFRCTVRGVPGVSICASDLTGGSRVRLTTGDAAFSDYEPTVSRDGATLAFTRADNSGPGSDILYTPLAGGSLVPIPGNTGEIEEFPRFGVVGWNAAGAASLSARFPAARPAAARARPNRRARPLPR